MKAIKHLRTINNHKKLVMESCFKMGLIRQGILHDLSKYSPTEFIVGAIYYQGDRSPNNAEREKKGYTSAWLHHKGRNKHHMEYWIDYTTGEGEHGGMGGMKMPTRYVVEMFADRVAACKNYQKDEYTKESALKYYERGKEKHMIHEDTAALLEHMLKYLAKYGEKKAYAYVRRYIMKNDLYCLLHFKWRKGEYDGYEVRGDIRILL